MGVCEALIREPQNSWVDGVTPPLNVSDASAVEGDTDNVKPIWALRDPGHERTLANSMQESL
jgi:hypothetical protein